MTRGTITSLDVARYAGVSRSTVANILNYSEYSKYSDETRKKVFKAAEEIGYNSFSLRRAIKSPLKNIGFVVYDPEAIEFSYMGEIWKGVRKSAIRSGYEMMFCDADWKLGDEKDTELRTRKIIEMARSRLLDGLVIDKARFNIRQLGMLEEMNIPFVCINGRIPLDESKKEEYPDTYEIHRKAYWVCIDYEKAGFDAAMHLINLGHKRIAMLNPEFTSHLPNYGTSVIGGKIIGFKKAMKNIGQENDSDFVIETSTKNKEVVLRAVDKLMASSQPPTAIFAADDAIAILVINYLRAKGLRVPDDISIMGFGSWAVSFVSDVELTTMSAPWAQMGEIGVEILVELLKDKKPQSNLQILETKLVEGATVSTPR